jgi:hypothetical protein
MTSRSLLGTVLLLGGCAGGALYTTSTATPAAAPADAITCVRTKLNDLDYQLVAFDQADHRLIMRHINQKVYHPEPQFRRVIDRIEAQAEPGASGKTDLKLVAHTVAEYNTQRGPTETEERASNDVKDAVQAVLQACGQS